MPSGARRLNRLVFLLALTCWFAAELSASPASLDGRVLEAGSGQPIGAAQVELRLAGSDSGFQAESDQQGRFRFPALEAGDYLLTADAPGHFSNETRLRLKLRQPLVLTIELARQTTLASTVTVRESYVEIDPGQTGTSRILTRPMLESLPAPLLGNVRRLAENIAPGAVLGHDNLLHVRGNELSLHQAINGVSFLDNPQEHFNPGLSPQIFESVNLITGGFPAEFGNRFGGILDISTRSGGSLDGHGAASLGLGTVLNHNAAVEYGASEGRFGYYLFASGFQSGRFLNPPTQRELHDFGRGLRATAQLDYQGEKNLWKLLLTGGGTNFELPNTERENLVGRDTFRRLRSQTAILTWQRIFSPRALLSTSLYGRDVSDRLLPTTDPLTPFGQGSRSTLTTGLRSDFSYARSGHTLKTGIDLTLLRLRESFGLDPREDAGERGAFSFGGHDLGGQTSLYVQDRFSPFRNFTLDAGVRWDQVNLVGSYSQVSPRVGLAYHVPQFGSVIHFAYNRFFVPPPLEYVVLASYLGNQPGDEHEPVGNVRPYTQNYYEVGWNQRLHRKVFLEANAYAHRGRNAFETREISNTRLFLPINFHRARASGAEVSLVLDPLERLGLSGRLQYAAARVRFFGPVSGGFPGEEVAPGQEVLPAFDQVHTGTASLFYRNGWQNFRAGWSLRYGRGTPIAEVRLPQHLTADFVAGVTVWQRESRRLELEFNLTNLSNNIYRIAKESETTPFQFADRRVIAGRLSLHF